MKRKSIGLIVPILGMAMITVGFICFANLWGNAFLIAFLLGFGFFLLCYDFDVHQR
jgi:hypothetical protein